MVYHPRGGRRRALLSMAGEQGLLVKVEQDGAKGVVKTAADIRNMVESKVGRPVLDDVL